MKNQSAFTIFTVLLTGTLFLGTFGAGCGRGGGGEDIRNRNSVSDIRRSSQGSGAEQTSEPISDEELETCANNFIEDLNVSIGKTIISHIDVQRCVKIFENNDSFDFENNADLRKMRQAIREMLTEQSELTKQFDEQMNNSNFYYVGPKRTAKKSYAVIRIELAAGGITYYLLSCRKTKDGQVEAFEIYMPMTGLTFEETFALSMAETAKGLPSVLKTMNPFKRKQLLDMLKSKAKMTKANLEGDYQTVISTYESGHLQESNSQMVDYIYLTALGNVYVDTDSIDERRDLEKRMTATLDLLKKRDPQFVGSYFHLLDVYFMKNDMKKFDEAVAAINEAVGKDPYWSFYRGALYVDSDPSKALECYNKALEEGLTSSTFFVHYNSLLKSMPGTTEKQFEDFYNIVAENYCDDFVNQLKEATE